MPTDTYTTNTTDKNAVNMICSDGADPALSAVTALLNIEGVDAANAVEIIHITTLVKAGVTRELRNKIYAEEEHIIERFPGTRFEFHLTTIPEDKADAR